MGINKEQSPESNNKSNYETAVLDFLDKEMAAVQPNKKQNESGQEVDALVTDLLKQVITESNQPSGGSQTVYNSLEAALSEDPPMEVPPIEEKEAPPGAENLESSDEAENPPIEDTQDSPAAPSQEPPTSPLFNPRIPGFVLGMAPRQKAPIIAVASVCLLVAISATVYYLWGSSRMAADAREFQPAAAASLAPENTNMDVPATLQQPNSAELESPSPAGKLAASRQIPSQSDRKAPAAPSMGSAAATPAQKAAVPEPEPAAPVATDRSANAKSDIEPELPTVELLTNQISAPSPLTVASNLAIDKSAPPPMPDGITLANSALERNPVLASQSQTPGPAGSRNLAPSILISQVSTVYPELAIRSRTSGSVVLELQIDREGKVVEATPVSGPSVFYSEAVKAAMQYRYRPATLDGKNVSSKSRVTMVFNLNR